MPDGWYMAGRERDGRRLHYSLRGRLVCNHREFNPVPFALTIGIPPLELCCRLCRRGMVTALRKATPVEMFAGTIPRVRA